MKKQNHKKRGVFVGLLILTVLGVIWTGWYGLLLVNFLTYDSLISKRVQNFILHYFSPPIYRLLKGMAVIILAFCMGLLVKTLLLGIVLIPSSSMEPALMTGDWALVNKLCYGPLIPFVFMKRDEQKKLKGYTNIKRDDIIVFKRNKYEKQLVKRCVGLPGEQIEIKEGAVYVNAKLLPNQIKTGRLASFNYYTFPRSAMHRWSPSNFGPLLIPGKGVEIEIEFKTIDLYKEVIRAFENKKIMMSEDGVYIDGRLTKHYTFMNDYYFVLGDNRDQSRDSRFFGFVPEKAIRGRITSVLYSSGDHRDNNLFGSIFKKIK